MEVSDLLRAPTALPPWEDALKKVKFIAFKLLQAWTGPEVSRRLSLPDLKTVGT